MGSFEDVRAWAQALAAANHLTPVTVPPSLTHPPALQLDPELAAQIEKARAEITALEEAVKALQIKVARLQAEENEARG
jgi:hypothetical protein